MRRVFATFSRLSGSGPIPGICRGLPVFLIALLAAEPAFAQTSTLSLDLMLAKFVGNIAGPIEKISYLGCFTFGIYLLVKGLFKCIKYSDEGSKGQQKFSGIWGTLAVGALLIALPSTVTTMGETLYGSADGYSSAATIGQTLSYTNVDSNVQARMNMVYSTILVLLQMIGLISFIRGLSILRSVTDGNTQVTSMAGITHVIAGSIAWNFGAFVQTISKTIGFDILSGGSGVI